MTVGEWDQRQLCPDGGCVGVIGPEGTCTVCGRVAPNWGDERTRGLVDPEGEATDGEAEDDDDEHEDDEEAGDDGELAADVAAGDDGDWPDRELCSDGACIGVIGADGHCKVCGKPGAAPRPEATADAEAVAPEPAPAPEASVNSIDPEPKS